MASFGQFQRSGGPLVRLTPQGWVSETGESMSLPSGYGGFQRGGGDIPLSALLQGQEMGGQIPMANAVPEFSRAQPMEYMGRKGFLQPDRSLVDAEGRMIFEPLANVQGRQQEETLRRRREAEDVDLQMKRADLAAKQGGEWHIDSASGMMINKRSGEIKPIGGERRPAKLSATSEKELYEADEMQNTAAGVVGSLQAAKDLNEKAYSGWGALPRAAAVSNLIPGATPDADATVQMDNIIREQALSGMKAIFGGNPTEGERAILMEIQASVNKTPAQRAALLDRAMQMAQRRAQFNQQKAEMIRGGGVLQGMPSQPSGPRQITSDAEYNALPKGAMYITPDGATRVKR